MATMQDPYVVTVYQRALQQGGDAQLIQLWFDAAVLEKYRSVPQFSVLRTDTIGRISRDRTWSLDFGIADDDSIIHASLSDLVERLPEADRDHWAQHVVVPPISPNFLRTRGAPASCIDDGDLRQW